MGPPQFTVTYPGYCIDSHSPRFFWPLMKLRGAPLDKPSPAHSGTSEKSTKSLCKVKPLSDVRWLLIPHEYDPSETYESQLG